MNFWITSIGAAASVLTFIVVIWFHKQSKISRVLDLFNQSRSRDRNDLLKSSDLMSLDSNEILTINDRVSKNIGYDMLGPYIKICKNSNLDLHRFLVFYIANGKYIGSGFGPELTEAINRYLEKRKKEMNWIRKLLAKYSIIRY